MNANGDHNPDLVPADATRRRLAALKNRPIDLSRLESAIESEIDRPAPVVLRHPAMAWRGRMMSIAASILLVLTVGVAAWFALAPRPAVAAPQLMAMIHDEALGMPHIKVESFGEARAALNREWNAGPEVPTVAGAVPMECCMHHLGSKVLKCVSLDAGGEKVVMAVARNSDVRAPEGRVVEVNGRKLVVTSSGGVNMVMSEHNGRWICLMGRVDEAKLIDLAGSIQ